MRTTRRLVGVGVPVVVVVVVLTMMGVVSVSGQLTMGWVDWPRCYILNQLIKDLWDGGTVNVTCHSVPEWWASDYANGVAVGAGPDLLVWDSQWIGQLVKQQWLVDVTDLLEPIADDFYNIGTYGQFVNIRQGHYYGFGLLGDTLMLIYRKDLFDAWSIPVPGSWDDILETSKTLVSLNATKEGFTTLWCGDPVACYDAFATTLNQLIWDWGGKIWDDSNYQIRGILDTPTNAEALSFARDLLWEGSCGIDCASDSYVEVISKLCDGTAALGITYVGWWPIGDSASACLHAADMGFARVPALNDVMIGGMGVGINKATSNLQLSKDFLVWLSSHEIQREWGLRGGLTTRKDVLVTSEFSQVSEANAIYAANFPFSTDFWRLPEYNLLLPIHMSIPSKALTDEMTPQDALHTAALEEQQIMNQYYPCGPHACSHTGLILGLAIPLSIILIIAFVLAFLCWYLPHRARVHIMEVEIEKGENAFHVSSHDLVWGPLLGKGTFACVYWAMWRATPVAVKKINTSSISEEAFHQFEKEVETMKRLRHPNIVLWLGCSLSGEDMLIVTEFMPNGSLASVLHNETLALSLSTKLAILHDAATGMAFLHTFSPPIFHGDLKSYNLLLDSKLNCKVSDFGLTLLKNDGDGAFRAQKGGFGALLWTAPEVLNGESFTAASDIYSYGIVVWEVVTRQQPYNNMDAQAALHAIMAENLRPAAPSKSPKSLLHLMRKCWEKSPSSRPTFPKILEDWPDLMNSLETDLAKEASLAQIPPPTGEVTIVFTDIQQSTTIWEWNSDLMKEALELHNTTIRESYHAAGGYEVKTEGDSFMLAFPCPEKALSFCAKAQKNLLDAPWDPELLKKIECGIVEEEDTKQPVFRGLRVRMGLHTGKPNCGINPVVNRMDYTGHDVNKAARISAIAVGGMILCSQDVYLQVKDNEDIKELGQFLELGKVQLKGIATSEIVYEFSTKLLPARKWESLNSGSTFQGIMSGGLAPGSSEGSGSNDDHLFEATESSKPQWIVPFREIECDRNQKLGSGSFGEVFIGKWRGQEVAVKFFYSQDNQIDVNDFRLQLREISILGNLRHPNIVLFMCACIEQPNMCLVTELVENGNLRDVLDNEHSQNLPLQVSRSLSIAKGIAQGMSFLHASSIIHRDLKSLNVLLTKNYEVKLSDFGLSRIKSTHSNSHMTPCGSPVWSAPEVLSSTNFSWQADVYSFGIILWEMLTGLHPWAGKPLLMIVNMVSQGARPDIPNTTGFPSEYLSLMKKCWAGSPADRPKFSAILNELSHV
ncbi:serine/threonine protein kinase [Pelomyxa schiedti]|nr:serine/threonine protein kinase [Pelomyxa schiedti]